MAVEYVAFTGWDELFELVGDSTDVFGVVINGDNNSNISNLEVLKSGDGIIVNGFHKSDNRRALFTESFDPKLGAQYKIEGREVFLKSNNTELSFEVI